VVVHHRNVTMTTEAEIERELTEVLDPCSCLTDNPVDIVKLGLVENIDVDDGTARVRLLLTSGGCTYLPKISEEIESRLLELAAIDEVVVTQETEKIWTRERMDDRYREDRREWFREQMRANDITPYAEQTD